MNTKAHIGSLLGLALFVSTTAFAAGAGGMLFGLVQPAWNPNFMPKVPATLPAFEYMGGFGYGVTADRVIVGGFGLAIMDYGIADTATVGTTPGQTHAAGGVGGMLVGSRIIGTKQAHLDVAARLGVGGMGMIEQVSSGSSLSYEATRGYAIVYAEPYIELGAGLTPWMHLSATLGYPILGNLIPGKPFSDLLFYTPTIGCTLTFGSFR